MTEILLKVLKYNYQRIFYEKGIVKLLRKEICYKEIPTYVSMLSIGEKAKKARTKII